MTAEHPFPTARWIALGWLAVYLPAYALAYGLTNFMFLCNLSVLLFCLGLWRGSALLLSSQALGVLVVDVVWVLDVLSRLLTGAHWIGGTEYMWDPRWPLFTRLLSLYHAAMPFLLVWAVRRTGYDRRGLGLQSAIAAVAILMGRLESPQANLNFAWTDPVFHRPLGPGPLHLLLTIATLVLVVYLPTHLALARLFARGADARGKAGAVPASTLLLILAGGSLAAAGDAGMPAKAVAPERPRNVILMIGDGMGVAQVTAGLVAAGGSLQLERATVVGLSKTNAADALVTDSAAAATAMASGVKTRNGAVGMDTGGRPVPTLLELAERRGLWTGLVATSSVTDATPAAFAAHVASREDQEAIAAGMAASGVNVLVGGGRRFFTRRKDGRDLLGSLRRQGVTVVEDVAGLWALERPGAAEGAPTRVAALVADLDLPSQAKGRGDFLPRATHLALALLSRGEGGFFAMVEGSQIDWESHDRHGREVAAEMLDFDRAIGKALDFAAQDGRTLVVVTADHETGGMAIKGGSLAKRTLEAGFTTGGHTAALVPVFAFGPGAAAFAGVYDDTEIFRRIEAALGLAPGDPR